MKVLFIDAPKSCWPYITEKENILMPQAPPCLAAVLLKEGCSVKIIDCLPSKTGWASLKDKIVLEKPDIVCVSSPEFIWGYEAVKAARLAKEINPNVITIGGGNYFSVEEEIPPDYPVDFIVKGEGEVTLVELVRELKKPKEEQEFHKIKGLMYRDKNKTVITPPRPLIEDLDTLPFPAYNLMDMDYYKQDILTWSVSRVTIHHSRGCNNGCNFCSCWLQMANRTIKNGNLVLLPKWRTKSVKRTVAEIECLYKKYNCKKVYFNDDTWNLNPKWCEKFAKEVKEKNLDIKWAAFMRLDYILRDSKSNVMEDLMGSGLVHVFVGAERACDSDLEKMNKSIYKKEISAKALKVIREKYPSLCVNASFILGVRDETKDSIIQQAEYAKKLDIDFLSTTILTPIKNTPLWKKLKEEGAIEVEDLRCYDWYTPVMPSKYLNRKELQYWTNKINYFVDDHWFFKNLKGLFLPYSYRRKKNLYFLKIRMRIFINRLKRRFNLKNISHQKDKFSHEIIPDWYYK